MSSIKIKDLPEKTDTLNDEDLLVIEDLEDTKRISLIRMRAAFSMDGILTSMKNMLLDKINSFIETHSIKYKELVNRNTELETICHNLSNDHIHDAERIFKLEDELVIQKQKVVTLQTEKTNLLKLINQLELDKESLSEKLIELETLLSANQSSIVVLKSQVKDLQIKSKELKEKNEVLQNSLDVVEDYSNNIIDTNFNEVNTKLSETIEDIMAYIRYHHPDVDEVLNSKEE